MGRGQHWAKRLVMAIAMIASVSATAQERPSFHIHPNCEKNGHHVENAELKQDRWACRKELVSCCDEDCRKKGYQACMEAKGWECAHGRTDIPGSTSEE
jgi:hypothetical protein